MRLEQYMFPRLISRIGLCSVWDDAELATGESDHLVKTQLKEFGHLDGQFEFRGKIRPCKSELDSYKNWWIVQGDNVFPKDWVDSDGKKKWGFCVFTFSCYGPQTPTEEDS